MTVLQIAIHFSSKHLMKSFMSIPLESTNQGSLTVKVRLLKLVRNKEPEDLARLNKWAASVAKESNLPFDALKINHVFVVDARPKVALPIPTINGVLGSAIHD